MRIPVDVAQWASCFLAKTWEGDDMLTDLYF